MPLIKTDYRYSVYEDDSYEDAYYLHCYDWQDLKYDLEDEFDLQDLAEKCADDFYSNHDGWEYSGWNNGSYLQPFYIWTSETTKVKFEVQCEFTPEFHAYRK